jgi:hypothetical protein
MIRWRVIVVLMRVAPLKAIFSRGDILIRLDWFYGYLSVRSAITGWHGRAGFLEDSALVDKCAEKWMHEIECEGELVRIDFVVADGEVAGA